MIPGVFAASAAGRTHPQPIPDELEHVVLPLTYSESDYHNLVAWHRVGDGPLPTPHGGRFNGLDARLEAATVPAWIEGASAPVYIGAQVDVLSIHSMSGALPAPAAGIFSTDGGTRVALGVHRDVNDPMFPNCVVTWSVSSAGNFFVRNVCRPGWFYRGRYPERSVGGLPGKPQAVLFVDSDRLLVSAHYDNQLSRFHLLDADTGAVIGWFDFPQPHTHVASACFKSDGSLWVCDYNSGALMRIDLEQSLSTNEAAITLEYDLSLVTGRGAINWAVIDGQEYLLAAVYSTSSTGNYIYVIKEDDIADGGAFNITHHAYRRYESPKRQVQGILYRDGLLYIASNQHWETNNLGGCIGAYPFFLSHPNGAYLPDPSHVFPAPNRYIEDIDVRPGTEEIWTSTEGRASTADEAGHVAIWSAPLDGSGAAPNYISVFHDGANLFRVRVNGHLFDEVTSSTYASGEALAIGGMPSASPDRSWHANAIISNVVVQPDEPSSAQIRALLAGQYESRVLEGFPVPLINPGAEDGLTGWTNEVGGVVNRDANPPPHSGLSYFSGGSVAESKARQRHSIESVTGLSPAEIDGSTLWARIEWWQAGSSSDGTPRDQATCGLRVLDGGSAALVETEGLLDSPFDDFWVRRSHAIAIPAGARSLDALMRMWRRAGTVLQGNVDDIGVTIYRR